MLVFISLLQGVLFEACHTVGQSLLVFVVMPQLDPISCSVLCLVVPIVPYFLSVISTFAVAINNRVAHANTGAGKSMQPSCFEDFNTSIARKILGVLMFIAAFIFFLLYLSLSIDNFSIENKDVFVAVFVLSTILTSLHWLENNASSEIFKCSKQNWKMYTPYARKSERLIISFCKIILSFLFVVFYFAFIGDNNKATLDVLFNQGLLSNLTIFGRDMRLTSGPDILAGCAFIDPFLLALLCCSSGFVFWKLSRHACRILLQIQDFALPIVINIGFVPVCIYLIIYNSNNFGFGNCDLSLIVQLESMSADDIWSVVATGVLGWFAMVFLTLDVWERGQKFAEKDM